MEETLEKGEEIIETPEVESEPTASEPASEVGETTGTE